MKLRLLTVFILILANTVTALGGTSPFNGPGTIVQGNGCLLFQTESGASFVPVGFSGSPGDYLWVSGFTDAECGRSCGKSEGCLMALSVSQAFKGCGKFAINPQGCLTFITTDGKSFLADSSDGTFPGKKVQVTAKVTSIACPEGSRPQTGLTNVFATICPIPTPFSGCGVLKTSEGACPIVFESDELFNGKHKVMTLENLGSFGIGDHVFVKGDLFEGCYDKSPFFCPADCLSANTIGSCDFDLSLCGTLVVQPMCGLLFAPDEGGLYKLDEFGGFGAGDRVVVTGNFNFDCGGTVECLYSCIKVASITACETPAPTFAGCGTLQILFECGNAIVTKEGLIYLVGDIGKFEIGDQVFVSGTIVPGCANPLFCNGLSCLENVEIGECFDECGVLVQGTECILFSSSSGLYPVENLGPFVVGDSVRVQGLLNPGCISFCQQGNGCIENNTIEKCVTAEPFVGCGTIIALPFCGLALKADVGGVYLLNTSEDLKVGDDVFVSGTINPACITLPECPVGACIDVAVIKPCGQNYFSGCGVLVIPFACDVALAADDGSGLYVVTGPLASQLPLNGHIFIEGPINESCRSGPGDCPCVEVLSWSQCIVPEDLNADGKVDGADLGMLLGGWGPCPPFSIGCVGDINWDGQVDGADLGMLLGAWTG